MNRTRITESDLNYAEGVIQGIEQEIEMEKTEKTRRVTFMEERKEHFPELKIFPSDDPTERLRKILNSVEQHLTEKGFSLKMVEKAKMFCPDYLEKVYLLEDKIDSEFLKQKELLTDKTTWLEFERKTIVPYFLAWIEIIERVGL